MSEQLPPVRVDESLQDEIVEFAKENGFESTSAAIRHLLERGLREEDVSGAALVLASHSDSIEKLDADTSRTLLESWRDFMDSFSSEIDIVTLAGGENEVSKEQLAAAYRFQRKEATEDDFYHIVDMIQNPVNLESLAGKLEE